MGPGTAVGTSLPSAKTKLGAIAVAKPATINSGKSASSSNSIRQGKIVQPGCAAALSKPSFALLPKDRVRGVISPHLVVQVEC